MTVLFGHPTGNPNSHHAALAHFEAKRLEAFCVPWMPLPWELALLKRIPGLGNYVGRLERRYFPALRDAPRIEGRLGEWVRMLQRIGFGGRFSSERLSYEANDWLMRTMERECRRPAVTAVHAYEDCSLLQFEAAKRRGKACIYDLPIGYYPTWELKQAQLASQFEDWLPQGLRASMFVRPEQKRRELLLADLVLVPCSFARRTIEPYATKNVAVAPYGVDLEFWSLKPSIETTGPLRFIYAGQCSLRKGIPDLLEAWRAASLADATLDLVGSWQLAETQLGRLPQGVTLHGPVSSHDLRAHFHRSDVFVFPSFFEGFGLVILEAMACGLPVIATDSTAGPDVLTESTGRVIASGDVEALVESLRWFASNRQALAAMGIAARAVAEKHTWAGYRMSVADAVAPFSC